MNPSQQSSIISEEEAYKKKLETTPHAQVELPSGGLVYDKENPASNGVLHLSYMKGKHENILLSPSLIKNGNTFDVLLNELVLDKGFRADSLITSDKMFLLISARCMSLGFDYVLENFKCQSCDLITPRLELSLENITETQPIGRPIETNENKYAFSSPQLKDKLIFKLMTGADERELMEKMERLSMKASSKNTNSYEPLISYGIASLLVSINDDESISFGKKVEYIENLPITIVKQIQKFLESTSGNLEPSITHTCSRCDHETTIPVQVGLPFFFPKQ